MMVIFIINIAGPYFDMSHELLADFYVLIVDKGSEIVDVVGGLVEVFDGDWIRVSESD